MAVNNRPLSFVEDDVELPVLTSVAMMQVQSNLIPEEEADSVENEDLRKRAGYVSSSLQRCYVVTIGRRIQYTYLAQP